MKDVPYFIGLFERFLDATISRDVEEGAVVFNEASAALDATVDEAHFKRLSTKFRQVAEVEGPWGVAGESFSQYTNAVVEAAMDSRKIAKEAIGNAEKEEP